MHSVSRLDRAEPRSDVEFKKLLQESPTEVSRNLGRSSVDVLVRKYERIADTPRVEDLRGVSEGLEEGARIGLGAVSSSVDTEIRM